MSVVGLQVQRALGDTEYRSVEMQNHPFDQAFRAHGERKEGQILNLHNSFFPGGSKVFAPQPEGDDRSTQISKLFGVPGPFLNLDVGTQSQKEVVLKVCIFLLACCFLPVFSHVGFVLQPQRPHSVQAWKTR